MNTPSEKIRTVIVYIGLSVLVHLLVLFSLGRCGNYSFATPINPLQAVMIELTKPSDDAVPVVDSYNQESSHADIVEEDVTVDRNHAQIQGEEVSTPPAVLEKDPVEPKTVEPTEISKKKTDIIAQADKPA